MSLFAIPKDVFVTDLLEFLSFKDQRRACRTSALFREYSDAAGGAHFNAEGR